MSTVVIVCYFIMLSLYIFVCINKPVQIMTSLVMLCNIGL